MSAEHRRGEDQRALTTLLGLGGLGAAAVFLWNCWPSWATVVDDAYISARYARNLADGYGLTYTWGEPPVEGFTNLAWTLLLALGSVIGLPMHSLMTTLGFCFGLLSLFFAMALTEALIGRRTPWSLVPVFLLAIDTHLAVISTNGLESSLWVAGVLGACWATLAASDRWRWLAGVGVGSLVAIRPEGIAVAGALCVFDLARSWREPTRSTRWAIVLPALVWVLGIEAFRWLYFGDWLPNTFAAKASVGLEQLNKNNFRYIRFDRLYWYGALGLLLLSWVLPGKRAPRLVFGLIGLGLVAIAWSVILWMPGGRLLVPAVALISCCLVAGLGALPTWAGMVLLLPTLCGAGYARYAYDAHVRRQDRIHSMQPHNGAMQAALHLQIHGPHGAWLATRDGGVFPYYVGSKTRVAELHHRALTRPHPRGNNAEVLRYTPENPEYIVLTVSRASRTTHYYNNDRLIFQRSSAPYDYLGRVEQHHNRYYDVYVRSDLGIPPLPDKIVVNSKGVKPDTRQGLSRR